MDGVARATLPGQRKLLQTGRPLPRRRGTLVLHDEEYSLNCVVTLGSGFYRAFAQNKCGSAFL
jgi:hypothetical protein